MEIVVRKGLNIPLKGKPKEWVTPPHKPRQIALNFNHFETMRFRVLATLGMHVKIGEPLAENKAIPGQLFVSPASGVVVDIRRGLKRRLLAIVIAVDEVEEHHCLEPLDPLKTSREEILLRLNQGGIFPHIHMRPFDQIAHPKDTPRAIFVRALESLPFIPSAESQVMGHENAFHAGLQTLKRLTKGAVHLVYHKESSCRAFQEAENVEKHTAKGPHPVANASLHIQKIDRIKGPDDIVWTLSALDVVVLGTMIASGRYHTERVLSIAGSGLMEGRQGFFKGRSGFPVESLIADRIPDVAMRFISGDPLTGDLVTASDFLGFHHTSFAILAKSVKRERFHFLGIGKNKYSATRTYLSHQPEGGFSFTTNQHGEGRAFVDASLYDKVMPLDVPTMQFIKALITENDELAMELGLLEVASEDFALPTFICPSKIEMSEIVKRALHRHATDQ